MRTIWQRDDPVYDDDGRMIVRRKYVHGELGEPFVGVAQFSNAVGNITSRFTIEAADLHEAFDRYDAAKDAELERINCEARKARILGAAARAVPLVQ